MTNGTIDRTEAVPLHKRAMLLSLSFSKWSARKHDKQVSQEVANTHGLSDVNLGAYRKQLIAKEALDEINALDSQARTVWIKYTSAGRKEGERILSNMFYTPCTTELRTIQAEREIAVQKFKSNFIQFKEDQKKKLNGLFREEDYPTLQELDDKFDMLIDIQPMPDAAEFVVAGIVDEEVKRIEAARAEQSKKMVADAMRETCTRLLETITGTEKKPGLIQKLAKFEKLGSSVKHPFRDTAISNIKDMLDLLPGLNLTNDPKINDIADRIRKELVSLSCEDLRNDDTLRETAINKADALADEITAHMSNFI
jgi:hypothetical protein